MRVQCFGGPENGEVVDISPYMGHYFHFPRVGYGKITYNLVRVVVSGTIYNIALWEHASPQAFDSRYYAISKLLGILCGDRILAPN